MNLAVIADTHIPGRAEAIPDPFVERIAAADHTIHAGDFETAETLDAIREVAGELTAVHGNADPATIGLPAVADVAVEGVRFVVTHGTLDLIESAVYETDGMVTTGEEWVRAVADVARARTRAWDGANIVGIGGHTHRLEDTVYEGVRVLNPGSVTGADPADVATMLTIDVDDGAIEVTTHEAGED